MCFLFTKSFCFVWLGDLHLILFRIYGYAGKTHFTLKDNLIEEFDAHHDLKEKGK